MIRTLLRAAAALMLAAALSTPGIAQSGGNGFSGNGFSEARTYHGRVTGNLKSKVYRYPWDRKQPPSALRIVFRTVDEAEAQGYHLAPGSPHWRPDRRITGYDADGFGPETNFIRNLSITRARRPPLPLGGGGIAHSIQVGIYSFLE